MQRLLSVLCLAFVAGAASAAEPAATSFSLTCEVQGKTTTGASGDIRGDGVTEHPTRISSSRTTTRFQVSTEPKAVVLEARTGSSTDSDGVTTPYDPEGPRYIEDVRVLTPTMLVFCDDKENRCRPTDKTTDSGSRVHLENSPIMVNLADGNIGYNHGASVTGGNGSMLYSRTEYTGTCRKGG